MTATITSDTTTAAPKGITSGQKSQIIGLFVDATGIEAFLNELTLDQAQAIIIRGGEFKSAVSDETDTERLGEIVAEFGDTNPYADEEVESSSGYPEGFQMKSPLEQLAILTKAFPALDGESARPYIEAVTSQPLPEDFDGWAVVAKSKKIAPTDGEAIENTFDAIRATGRSLVNYREGELDEEHLRRSTRTADAFAKLDATQTGDFYVYPVQFGIRHAGKSVRRVRVVYIDGEFGNGGYEVAQLLLTHEDRLTSYDDLWIDCPGAEFSSGADGQFGRAPCFGFNDGAIGFITSGVGHAYEECGSSSGLLPQLQ